MGGLGWAVEVEGEVSYETGYLSETSEIELGGRLRQR